MEKRQERTFVMIKPDGVQRGLVGKIITRFEKRGLKLVGMKMATPSREHLEEHYVDLKTKGFFNDLVSYMMMAPVVAMVWQGTSATSIGRKLVGETNPSNSAPGTIRGDFCLEIGRNVVHASDSVDSANREIALWFNDNEVSGWTKSDEKWVFEV